MKLDLRLLTVALLALIGGMIIGMLSVPEREVTVTSWQFVRVTTTVTSVTTRDITVTVTEPGSNVSGITTTEAHTEEVNSSNGSVYCSFQDFKGSYEVQLRVLKVIRGEQADRAVKAANMFNKKPPKGYEYLLVNVEVKLRSGDKFQVNPLTDFKVEFQGRLVKAEWIVYPEDMPEMESVELLKGGSVSGWLAFIVPKEAEVTLHLEPFLMESLKDCKVSLGHE